MPRPTSVLVLSEEQRNQIEGWLAALGASQQVALRSRITLAAGPGKSEAAVASELNSIVNRYREPLRYIGIRVRRKQREMFEGGREVLPFAMATKVSDWDPKRLLAWHREKASSIEAVHDVLKNELGAGVLPSKRFGADAAWFRLAVITHNVLTGLKRLALPPELLKARHKRLRFPDLYDARPAG